MKSVKPTPSRGLDFKELPVDGQKFEQLARELLAGLGLHAGWSGRGPDGGRDLVCDEAVQSLITPQRRTWLVQCKHFAHSDRSVGIGDIDNIVDSCTQHRATGYLLFCSTQPSSGVVDRLEGITADRSNPITATYWDGVTLERLLSTPRMWAIAQRFMPASSGEWRIFATESPSRFVAHFKGYVFQLTNRVGSKADHHLPSISARISDIESLSKEMPEHHFIRPRSVYYDDKNGGYTWYIDYMFPQDAKKTASKAQLLNALHDGWALEDGQVYSWDVQKVSYSQYSDHYDPDHDDYYGKYLPNFIEGRRREQEDWNERYATRQEIEGIEAELEKVREASFNAMVDAFKSLPFIHVMNSVNCNPEDVHRLERRFSWADLAFDGKIDLEHLFTALLILNVSDDKAWHDLLSCLPQEFESHFRVSRVEIYLPGSGRSDESDEYIYDLTLSLFPTEIVDRTSARQNFNNYFDKMTSAIKQFKLDYNL